MKQDDGLNLVVAEGGTRSIKAFKKLMLRRIKWAGDGILPKIVSLASHLEFGPQSLILQPNATDADDDDDDELSDKPKNSCVLVWEGTVGKRAFKDFEMVLCRTEEFARDSLQKHGVPHYWDFALSQYVTEQS